MGTTRSLNDAGTAWSTTYYGGADMGTCFDISVQINDEEQVTATFTVPELIELLRKNGNKKALRKPSFDRVDL